MATTTKPDEITARSEGGSFTPAPEGSFRAVCADCIDLGYKVEQYQDQPAKLVWKVALVFQIDEPNPDTGRRFDVSKEFTLSFYETAALRKFLTAWRGKSYTEEEARAGAPLHKLVGVNCALSVEHKTSRLGRTYAVISSVSPLLRVAGRIEVLDYERASFWAARKTEYAERAETFRNEQERQQRGQIAKHEPAAFAGDPGESEIPF